MHDSDAPPRLRWRLLAWGSAAAILLPVLYVAMVGPVVWWSQWHYPNPVWFESYYRSLSPLYQSPQINKWLVNYTDWSRARPGLRPWQRERIVQEIANIKRDIEVTYELERLGEKDPYRLARIQDKWVTSPENGKHPSPQEVRMVYQMQLQAAEQQLRQFDVR